MTHTWGWYNASDGNVPDNQNRGQVRVRAAGLTSGLGGVHLPTQLHGERAHAVPAVCRVAHGPADLLTHRGRTGGVDDIVSLSLCRYVIQIFSLSLSILVFSRCRLTRCLRRGCRTRCGCTRTRRRSRLSTRWAQSRSRTGWARRLSPSGPPVCACVVSLVFTADMLSDGVWYTDSNGRDMQKRVFNYRPTWKLNVTDP